MEVMKGRKEVQKHTPVIISDDGDILAVYKPSGVAVHGDGRIPVPGETKRETLADWVWENYPEIREVGEKAFSPNGEIILRPGIVHRLDRETSGIMLLAKNQETFLALKKEFQERRVKKTYRAFVYGNVKNDEGKIEKPIGRSRSNPARWSAEFGAKGRRSKMGEGGKDGGGLREAITEYRVLARGREASSLELSPKTGRTHQIRVHLKSIGHPVVCDKIYAPNKPPLLGFSRLALHALAIEFSLPQKGAFRFEAELPEDFQQAGALLSAGSEV